MKNILKALSYSFVQMLEDRKINVLHLVLEIVRRVGIAICMMFFPQRIVRELIEKNFMHGLGVALLFCICILIGEVFLSYVETKRKEMEARLNVQENIKLSAAIMRTSYEQTEQKTYLEKVDFAKACIERKSVAKICSEIIEAVAGVISLSGAFFIVFRLPPFLLLFMFLAVVLSAIGEIFRLRYTYDRYEKGQDIERNLYYARNDLAENRYAKDIRIWNLYCYISKKVEKYAGKLCALWSETSIKSVKVVGWTYAANGLQYAVVYAFLAWMTYRNAITIDEFVLYASTVAIWGDSLKDVLNAVIGIGDEFKYIEGIRSIIDGGAKAEEVCEQAVVFRDKIELKHIWFRYQGATEYVFRDLNLTIEKGKKYSVVGVNGAGKTTFVKLLLGLYHPEKGEILIDGKAVKNCNEEGYRRNFSCVFQDYHIYGFSVRENIAFQENNLDKIEQAMKRAGIKEKVEMLPKKEDTLMNREINDDATVFSGGQEQQLALARALYKDAGIYILDEPTAALSPSMEIAVYQQCYEELKEKTVIFISHRLASCVLSDEIIVLDDGRVSERGTHEKLVSEGGLYADMFRLQAEAYIKNEEQEDEENL